MYFSGSYSQISSWQRLLLHGQREQDGGMADDLLTVITLQSPLVPASARPQKKAQLEEITPQVNSPLGSLDATKCSWGRIEFSHIEHNCHDTWVDVQGGLADWCRYNHADSPEEFEEAFSRGNIGFDQPSVPVGCPQIETLLWKLLQQINSSKKPKWEALSALLHSPSLLQFVLTLSVYFLQC